MLSSEDYNKLFPYREGMKHFQQTGHYRGEALSVIDEIRQRMGMRPLNYGCEGCKVEAMNDIIYMIQEYEEAKKK